MPPQTFHPFPQLPRELRDEIWRLCLPRRVIELDLPDMDWSFKDSTSARRPCELWLTSRRNRDMPTITRVCRESRQIAFETGQLHKLPYSCSRSRRMDGCPFWADMTRDTLHSHWHTFLDQPAHKPVAGPLQFLVELRRDMPSASVTADLLDSIESEERYRIMHLLQMHPRWSVCGAVVSIHATDKAAISASGLWGLLGEEPIVLVDARDARRINAFRDFWQAYGTLEDVETSAFFDTCFDGVPKIHYMETPEDFLEDLQVRWLQDCLPLVSHYIDTVHRHGDVFLTTPETYDGREDDPRQADYGDLPGRPFARCLWSPNRDHPWVQEILSKVPDFRPTVMFRLCTGDCLSQPCNVGIHTEGHEMRTE